MNDHDQPAAAGPVGPAGPEPGRAILWADAAGTALFALTAGIEAVLLQDWSEVIGIAVALGLFGLGCIAFLVGYATAIGRSRTDEISVAALFLLMGPAVPGPVKKRLLLLLAAQVLIAVVTAAVRPFTPLAFGILAPMFGLGLNGLWAARHGQFPPRIVRSRRRTSTEDLPRSDEMEQNA